MISVYQSKQYAYKHCIKAFFVAVLVGIGSFLSIGASAGGADSKAKNADIEAIDILRGKLEKAYLSRNPADFEDVLADDFVLMQANHEGPSTYGKKFFYDYLPALDPIAKIEIKPIKAVDLYGNWAMESGEMYMDVVVDGKTVPMISRYMRVLHREPTGWKLAREATAMAKDHPTSKRMPPKPGFITYTGKPDWNPRKSPDPAEPMLTASKKLFDDAIRVQDLVNKPLEGAWSHPDDFLMINPSQVLDWKTYVAWRKSFSGQMVDEVEKYYYEAIVEGDFGFAWGHSVSTAAHTETGVRDAMLDFNLYMFKRSDEGVWKIWEGWYSIMGYWETEAPK